VADLGRLVYGNCRPEVAVRLVKEEVDKLDHRRVTRGTRLVAQRLLSSELEGFMADKTILVLVRPK
jgi:hypothetical protein